jgi:oligopeptide/dipeptide ABC transporter ATP-binding protein
MTVPAHTRTAINLERVTKVYLTGGGLHRSGAHKVIALSEVDLSVRSGEIFGLVGESGSGKTTIGRLIVRLERPSAGKITVNGDAIDRLRGAALKNFRRRTQMIFQDPYQSLNPYFSVLDTVAEPLAIHKLSSSAAARSSVTRALEMVGLSPAAEFLSRYPHQLSGGERQRVAIARAMVLEPEVVVADEPTSMLDASMAVQIFQILTDIQRRKHMTLLFITHNLAAAHYLCDRIAVIYRGHIVETGPAKAIISSPCHPYTRALIDALPRYGRGGGSRRYNTLRSGERSTPGAGGCPFFARCNRADENLCGDQRPKLYAMGDQHYAACCYAENFRQEK